MMSLGALWQNHKERARPATQSIRLGVPIVAAVLLGYALYASVIPQPAFPFNLTPVAVAGVVVVSLIAAVYLRRKGNDLDFGLTNI
jgi:hypothetical protein